MNVNLKVDWERRQICLQDLSAGGGLRWNLGLGPNKFEGVDMAVTITAVQSVTAAISAVDGKGNAAKLDGIPEWAVSDPAGLSLTPAPDGLGATIAAVGPVGTYQVTVKADADLGAGVRELVGVLDVEVVAGEAVAISFQLGQPA